MILSMLKTKVQYMEGGVKPWVGTKLEVQDRQVYRRLDEFDKRMTRQLGSEQILTIAKVKTEVVEIKKMVSDLYDRPFILALVVLEVELEIHIKNIQEILKLEEKGIRQRKKKKHQSSKREPIKKEKNNSLQTELD